MKKVICFILLLCASTIVAEEPTSIGIFAYGKALTWDPESIKSGVPGSEEAVIYIARELADLGYNVVVIGNPPANSPYKKAGTNPRYISPEEDDQGHFDIGINWRQPNLTQNLKKRADHVYLWPHDTYHWKLSTSQIDALTDVLWLSEWQRQQWIEQNAPFAKFTKIFGNAIVPEQFEPVHERNNPYSCIYGSNYARGLAIMLAIWPEVKKQYPKATLDIYYGWNHWGLLSKEQEDSLRKQVADLKTLGVTEHGMVGHEELNKAYGRSSIWTYPCIAPETFCITAIRAQLSGAVPVIIEGTALKETVRYGYRCTKPEEYLPLLLKAMKEIDKATLADRQKMGDFVVKEYTWKAMAKRWDDLFKKGHGT